MPHLPASSALQRFRVIDLTQVRAGPTACRQLADWGADVVQVQMPEHMRGDDTLGGQDASDYQYTHRNKRSITLNLKEAEGIATLKRLIAGADVVVENFRPDVKFRLGIDYETLAADNPAPGVRQHLRLRPDGPARVPSGVRPDRAGHGRADVRHGHARRRRRCASASRSPTCAPGSSRPRASWSRLLEREASGKGQWLHTSLLESMVYMMDFQTSRFLIDGEVADAGRKLPPDQHPDRGLQGPRRLPEHRGVRLQDLGALLQHPRRARMDHGRALPRQGWRVPSTVTRSMPRSTGALPRKTAATGSSNSTRAASPADSSATCAKHSTSRRSSTWAWSRRSSRARLGPQRMVGQPVQLERTPSTIARAAPRRGEHTEEVLLELGLGRDDLARMKAQGVY